VTQAVDYSSFNHLSYKLESSAGWSTVGVQSWMVEEQVSAANFDPDGLHRDENSNCGVQPARVENQIDLCRPGHKSAASIQTIAPCNHDQARKSVNDAGSPYRRHTASLIRRIDTLLARRSAPHIASCPKPRKSRPGAAQRPRARNVVLKELVELLRKTQRDEQVA
jgi:hypothetical protein